jgi:hypothetical protein
MEISNKAFGIICLGVVAVTVYVRAQSLHSPAQTVVVAEAPKTVEPTVKQRHHGIPDSPLPPDPYASATTDQTPSDDAPITVEAVPTAPSQPPAPAATTQPADAAGSDSAAEDDLTYQDDIGPMADDVPTNNSVQLSDRDMLRIMMNSMPDQQQNSFRMMWFTMTPDDRQDFLDQLRDIQQTGG